jgi:hypothetical protein
VAVLQSVIARSEDILRCGFWRPTERIVYWAGVKRDGLWLVTTVIRPKAVLTRGSFRTSPAANAEVVDFLAVSGLSFIAQVHTHPNGSVDHSDGDERDAFMPIENGLSLVVRDYGRQGMLPLTTCGVHRYESGRFRRLRASEVEATLCVTPDCKEF